MPGGYFIALEGIDGSGKTEQARRLAEWLRSCGNDVLETREPTDGPWGRRYRAWARGETEATPEQVLEFFERDRSEHIEKQIAPALAAGAVVICDRYVASTLAYQAAQGIDRERLRERAEACDFPEPDLVLWLLPTVAVAIARLGSRGSEERFEHADFLERVDAEYARLGLDLIAADGSIEEIQVELRRRVNALGI